MGFKTRSHSRLGTFYWTDSAHTLGTLRNHQRIRPVKQRLVRRESVTERALLKGIVVL
jgi:hypothetical protein